MLPILALNDAYDELKKKKPNFTMQEYRQAVREACNCVYAPSICESLCEDDTKKESLKRTVDKLRRADFTQAKRKLASFKNPKEELGRMLEQKRDSLESDIKNLKESYAAYVDYYKEEFAAKGYLIESFFDAELLDEGIVGDIWKKLKTGAMAVGRWSASVLGSTLWGIIKFAFRHPVGRMTVLTYICMQPNQFLIGLISGLPLGGLAVAAAYVIWFYTITRAFQWFIENYTAAGIRDDDGKLVGQKELGAHVRSNKMASVDVYHHLPDELEKTADVDFKAVAKQQDKESGKESEKDSGKEKEEAREKMKAEMLSKIEEIRKKAENKSEADRQIEDVAAQYQKKWEVEAGKNGWNRSSLHDAKWFTNVKDEIEAVAKEAYFAARANLQGRSR